MQSTMVSAGGAGDHSTEDASVIANGAGSVSGMGTRHDRGDGELPGMSDSFRVLLALDDDSVARAAARVTAAAARTCGAVPTVLQVIEVNTYCTPNSYPEMTNAAELVAAVDAHHEYRDELLMRVSGLVGHSVDWQARLAVGSDIQHIVRRAQNMDAELIVMGMEYHGRLRRALVGDTVRQVIASGVAPVLAVARTLESLPRHAVVGVDFSVSSIRAAQWARRLLDPHGLLELVYVGADGVSAADANQTMARRIEHDFGKLLVTLNPPPTMRVVSMRRSGNAAEQLSMYADEVKADLIAVGSHRYTFLERLRLGSVSAAVLSNANCSVLVAPPEPI